MKRLILSTTFLVLTVAAAHAAIVVPGANGTDGALNVTQDTVIDLSKATTGTWDRNNSANAGNGVYDPAKWAVVFKYTSVNVLAGKKLTFKNHATRAPVVWLVSGNVTISGTVDLSGKGMVPGLEFNPFTNPNGGQLMEPGPGGFRGGAAWRGGDLQNAAGFGPGGGRRSTLERGSAGGYGSKGSDGWVAGSGGNTYGNPSIVPLIGGSGGAGSADDGIGVSGGSGGGALLIAATGTVQTNNTGSLVAVGGNGWADDAGAGSGGSLRIICYELIGDGNMSAVGGVNLWRNDLVGGAGRIRLERVVNSGNFTISPAPSTVDLTNGSTALLWPPPGAPEARILSVHQVSAPSDPRSAFGAYTPDIALPQISNANVIVETVNVEQASKVVVRATPRNGATIAGVRIQDATEVTAKIKQVISENPLKIHWEATVPTLPGHSAIQARVVRP
jgi:hypothetical protein